MFENFQFPFPTGQNPLGVCYEEFNRDDFLALAWQNVLGYDPYAENVADECEQNGG